MAGMPCVPFQHTHRFHLDPTRELSTYTVFHGDEKPLEGYAPRYTRTPGVAALTSRNAGFNATAQQFVGADGRSLYRFNAAPDGASDRNSMRFSSNTLGSSGLPPVQYKAYSTEYVDEFREPVVSSSSSSSSSSRCRDPYRPASTCPPAELLPVGKQRGCCAPNRGPDATRTSRRGGCCTSSISVDGRRMPGMRWPAGLLGRANKRHAGLPRGSHPYCWMPTLAAAV